MTDEEKKYIIYLITNSSITAIFKFAKDKQYDYDTIVGLLCAEVINTSLDFKLKLDEI
jgi:hypothetical protein